MHKKMREATMPDRKRLLEMALKGLEADRAKLDEEIAEIRRELGNQSVLTKVSAIDTKRTMSPEARRRISEGMKRRYAELRKLTKRKAA
jgi:hypothetical protein